MKKLQLVKMEGMAEFEVKRDGVLVLRNMDGEKIVMKGRVVRCENAWDEGLDVIVEVKG